MNRLVYDFAALLWPAFPAVIGFQLVANFGSSVFRTGSELKATIDYDMDMVLSLIHI